MFIVADGIGLGDHLCLIATISNCPNIKGRRSTVLLRDDTLYRRSSVDYIKINSVWILRLLRWIAKFRLMNLIGLVNYSFESGRGDLENFLRSNSVPYQMAIGKHIFTMPARMQFNLPAKLDNLHSSDLPFGIQKPYLIVQSATKTSHTPYKNPSAERMMEVSNQFSGQRLVQVGACGDPSLDSTIDLRGRTTLDQLIDLVACAEGVVCVEGFLCHLAAACGVPAHVVFTGYSDPRVFMYESTVSELAVPKMPDCAPCYLKSSCSHGRVCLG